MRAARALIDLDALRSNYRLARRLAGGRALAIVKADAYGHGAVACARALESEADGFGVACIEEALALRSAGIRAPILLMEGCFDADELPLVAEHGLWIAVGSASQLAAVLAFPRRASLHVWLLLDSGMHRLGFAPDAFRAAHAELAAAGMPAPVLMTHMARADELDSNRTVEQLATFRLATEGLAGATSIGNSAATLAWPEVRNDWGRPGLMLYGANPFHPRLQANATQLRPVMTVESRIFAVREIGQGEPVGYGARFVAGRPTRVGVVAFGYADGYPQFAPNGTPTSIDGEPGRVIGRVSMDMLTVDLTDHPRAGIGSVVQLWGTAPSAAELAARCGTSAYALLCGLKRAPRSYLGS